MVKQTTQTQPVQTPQEKNRFTALVHYVLWYCKKYHKKYSLGAVKLNKILWAIDMHCMCKTGRSLSGEPAYVKRKLGPVPRHILSTLETLGTEGTIAKIQTGPRSIKDNSYSMNPSNCKVCIPPDRNVFTEEERLYIQNVCKQLLAFSAKQLSNHSHDEVYDLYEDGESIPLEVYLAGKVKRPKNDPATQKRKDRLMAEMKEYRQREVSEESGEDHSEKRQECSL